MKRPFLGTDAGIGLLAFLGLVSLGVFVWELTTQGFIFDTFVTLFIAIIFVLMTADAIRRRRP